jgi:hypothetical protein
MPRTFDGPFWLGGALTLAALAVAIGAVATPSLAVIGSGRTALIAVAILGMAACAVGGIGQAPTIGWTNPAVVAGSLIGVLALVVIVAGLGVWPSLVQPVGDVVSRATGSAALTVEQSAMAALAGIVAVKWVVGLVVAVTRTTTV